MGDQSVCLNVSEYLPCECMWLYKHGAYGYLDNSHGEHDLDIIVGMKAKPKQNNTVNKQEENNFYIPIQFTC